MNVLIGVDLQQGISRCRRDRRGRDSVRPAEGPGAEGPCDQLLTWARAVPERMWVIEPHLFLVTRWPNSSSRPLNVHLAWIAQIFPYCEERREAQSSGTQTLPVGKALTDIAVLEAHVLLPCDTTLATALAAAGLRADGRIGTAEVWVSAPSASLTSVSDDAFEARR
jgi:hypothetical protein